MHTQPSPTFPQKDRKGEKKKRREDITTKTEVAEKKKKTLQFSRHYHIILYSCKVIN